MPQLVALTSDLPELGSTLARDTTSFPLQLTIATVVNEDFAAMTRVQRGLVSNVASAIRIGSNEPALGMFHTSLAEALQT